MVFVVNDNILFFYVAKLFVIAVNIIWFSLKKMVNFVAINTNTYVFVQEISFEE